MKKHNFKAGDIVLRQGDVALMFISNSTRTTKDKKKTNIIARGEHSDHCHIASGDIDLVEENNETLVISREGKLKHVLESQLKTGEEVWTQEHKDIDIPPGTYKYVAQTEYHPYEKLIKKVQD